MTDQTPPHFNCTAIIGIGLIGSSLALALRERGLTDKIIGIDQDADVLVRASALNLIDHAAASLKQGVSDALSQRRSAPSARLSPALASMRATAPSSSTPARSKASLRLRRRACPSDCSSFRPILCREQNNPDRKQALRLYLRSAGASSPRLNAATRPIAAPSTKWPRFGALSGRTSTSWTPPITIWRWR